VNISGADLMVSLLEQHGVRTVAGIPGGAILPLYDALSRSRLIRHVLAKHEQAAGFIAQGMARVSGRAGVCIVTSGPGVTNMVTALADARLDSVPIICLAGQVSTHLIGTDAFQEVATIDMVRPITKACYCVKSAHEISDIFSEAFEVSESGRPGPVLIDLPKNVQTQIIEWQPTSVRPRCYRPRAQSVAASAAAYDRAAALIRSAKRPLVYCGGGVVKARAIRLARDFAELLGIPVTTSRGAMRVNHPESLLVPALMLTDYWLTVAGARLRDSGYASHFKTPSYELNPLWQKTIAGKRWLNGKHLALTVIVGTACVLLATFTSPPLRQ
jgi:acetolactate synthase-1/2/3 large subunit